MARWMRPWSHSRIKAARCPWRFEQTYRHGRFPPDLYRDGPGQLFHTAAQGVIEHAAGLRTERPDVDSSVRFMVRRMARLVPLHRMPLALFGVEQRYAMDRSGQPVGWKDPNAIYRGIIDLHWIDEEENHVVDDWKSWWSTEPVDEDSEVGKQLRGYAAILAHLLRGDQKIIVRAQFVRFGITNEVTLTRDDAERERTALLERINRTERHLAKGFPAQPGSWCATCHLVNECPLKKEVEASGHFPIQNQEHAEFAGAIIIQAAARLNVLRKSLREWTKRAGAITVGDSQIGYFVPDDPDPTFDLIQLARLLGKADIAPGVFLSLNKKAIGSILNATSKQRGTVKIAGDVVDLPDGLGVALARIANKANPKPTFRVKKGKPDAADTITQKKVRRALENGGGREAGSGKGSGGEDRSR